MTPRSPFHQYVVENWPPPRQTGECFTYNFDSAHYLVAITFMGSYYELCWWGHVDLDPGEGEVGLLETGTIADVCAAAEEFILETRQEEGLEVTMEY
jgi:hypothetical protein